MAIVLLVAVPVVGAAPSPVRGLAPAITLLPSSGPAGSVVGVTILDFTPLTAYEIRAGGFGGPLLKTGTTNVKGDGINTITIPAGTPPGSLTIAVCQFSVSCDSIDDEFRLVATSTFKVTGSTPTTSPSTTSPSATLPGATSSSTTATLAEPSDSTTTTPDLIDPDLAVAPEACVAPGGWGSETPFAEIPSDALVIDFDDLPFGPLDVARAPHDASPTGDDARFTLVGGLQWMFGAYDDATVGPTPDLGGEIGLDYGSYRSTPVYISTSHYGTVSTPQVARSDGSMTISLLGWRPYYVAFYVGGFPAQPEREPFEIEYQVTVRDLVYRTPDGAVGGQVVGTGTYRLSVGTEAIPVNRCVVVAIDNTENVIEGFTDTVIEIRPVALTPGFPDDMPLAIDSISFGSGRSAADEGADSDSDSSAGFAAIVIGGAAAAALCAWLYSRWRLRRRTI